MELLQLRLVLSVSLLLVLGNDVVNVCAAVSSWHVPRRAHVQDPVYLYQHVIRVYIGVFEAVLGESQLDVFRRTLVQEQVLVPSCLLDHLCVQAVTRNVLLLFCGEAIDQAREVGFLVGALGAKLVEGKGERESGNGNVEARLDMVVSIKSVSEVVKPHTP